MGFGDAYEPIALSREVKAVAVPSGEPVTLPEGMQVMVTQALGGSFTVNIGGNLARIASEDGDALGHEAGAGVAIPDNPTNEDIDGAVWGQLQTCFDPEIPINIVDLGLIYLIARKALSFMAGI